MNERKIVLFILSVIVYGFYSVHMWYAKYDVQNGKIENKIETQVKNSNEIQDISDSGQPEVKRDMNKVVPLFIKDACSILDILTQKPHANYVSSKSTTKKKHNDMDNDNNTITVIGITVFLLILTLNAVLDVLKVKEEERMKKKLNPDGERRQSLSEFAKKRSLRRESSKFGLQLFQIAESVLTSDEDKTKKHPNKTYTRADSTNSYLAERKKPIENSAPASIHDSSAVEPKLVKRQSVAKLLGARPVPMVRRSSYPALPLNPDIQHLMLGHRQPSVDSDDESDGRGRRVRIIRRY